MIEFIITQECYLLVNTEDQSFGYRYSPFRKEICVSSEKTGIYPNSSKILAHLPIGDNFKLDDVPLLPELPKQEEDVEQLAKQLAVDRRWDPNSMETRRVANEIINAYKEGYKATSKKWSDEDVRKAVRIARMNPKTDLHENKIIEALQNLQSSKLTPIGFEPEYEESKEYEIKPLPNKPYEGMKVLRDGKIGTVNMYSGKTDGSWTWALIKEFGYWNPPELKQVIFKKKLKIVNGVLQGTYKY